MTHAQLDERSLAFARAIANRLHGKPELVEIARANLKRWMSSNVRSTSSARNWREWLAIIEGGSMETVMHALLREDDEGQRLRQSNPFVGVLSPEEVRRTKQEFAHAAPGA